MIDRGGYHASSTTGGIPNQRHFGIELTNAALRQRGDSYSMHWTSSNNFSVRENVQTKKQKEDKQKRKAKKKDKKRDIQRRRRDRDDDGDQGPAAGGGDGRGNGKGKADYTQVSGRGNTVSAGGQGYGGYEEAYGARRHGHQSQAPSADSRSRDNQLRASRSPGRGSAPPALSHMKSPRHSTKTSSGYLDTYSSRDSRGSRSPGLLSPSSRDSRSSRSSGTTSKSSHGMQALGGALSQMALGSSSKSGSHSSHSKSGSHPSHPSHSQSSSRRSRR
jgi:hypothetical protein